METTQTQIIAPQTTLPAAEMQTALMTARGKATSENRYKVAFARPRDFYEVSQRLEKECLRPGFAKNARYFKPIGKGIAGPSIRFAEAALRLAGNISVETLVMFDDDEKRGLSITVTDLETNAVYEQGVVLNKTVERSDSKGEEILRSRTNSFGKPVYIIKATEDDLQNKQNAAVSKVMRNCILRLIPADIVETCMNVCVKTLNGESSKDPEAYKKMLIEAFFKLGIKVPELVEYLGHPLDTTKPEEITELYALQEAIKSGETTWKAVMQNKAENDETGEPKETAKKDDTLKNSILATMDKGKNTAVPATLASVKATEPPANASKTQKKPSGRDLFNAEIYKLNKTHEQEIKKLLGLFGYESTSELKDTELDQFMAQLRLMKPVAETSKKEAFL